MAYSGDLWNFSLILLSINDSIGGSRPEFIEYSFQLFWQCSFFLSIEPAIFLSHGLGISFLIPGTKYSIHFFRRKIFIVFLTPLILISNWWLPSELDQNANSLSSPPFCSFLLHNRGDSSADFHSTSYHSSRWLLAVSHDWLLVQPSERRSSFWILFSFGTLISYDLAC